MTVIRIIWNGSCAAYPNCLIWTSRKYKFHSSGNFLFFRGAKSAGMYWNIMLMPLATFLYKFREETATPEKVKSALGIHKFIPYSL